MVQLKGVETNLGFIGTKKLGIAASGNTSSLMNMTNLQIPLESFRNGQLIYETNSAAVSD